ncbi:MAG TPA: flagellar motor protein MotB [Gammaproteobacteria bacterium]|jgi:chemotaxis protein MotB|nr:flagellar motor protein MotB [Gammaproteobacteria bacterium]
MHAHRGTHTDQEFVPDLLDLGWDAEDRDDTWLVSYADIISTTLAMVVLLFGRTALTPQAHDAPPLTLAPPPIAAPAPPPARIMPATDTATPESRLAALVQARFAGRIGAEQRNEGVVLTIPEVALFDSARAQLHPSALPLLNELAATLREVGEAQISVEGHTDDRPVLGGEFRSNWDLAAARANAVTEFFLAQGFAPQRLHSVSYADTRPVADNASVNGRAANRRVELAIEFGSRHSR